jgi:hypothetical protein
MLPQFIDSDSVDFYFLVNFFYNRYFQFGLSFWVKPTTKRLKVQRKGLPSRLF